MSWRKRSQARLAQKLAQMDHAVLVEPWLEAAMPVAAIALIAPNSSVRLRQPEGVAVSAPECAIPAECGHQTEQRSESRNPQ